MNKKSMIPMTEKKHKKYHDENMNKKLKMASTEEIQNDTKLKEAMHKFFSDNGKKGGKKGGETTKRLYGIEHYRRLAMNMNEVKKAKREALLRGLD